MSASSRGATDPGGPLPGHVILLNGSPSAGKTTTARALWKELEPPHWYRSLDDFRQGYIDEQWASDARPPFERLFLGFIHSVREMALAGHHVIAEAIILPENLTTYLDALDGIEVYLVGVRCPLEVAQRRERERTDRLGSPVDLAVPWFDLVHADRLYDVEFDTSVTSTAEAVARIRAFLAPGRPPTAFEALRSWSRSSPRGGDQPATTRRDPRSGKPTFTVGAFAVVFDATGEVLLARRADRDLWTLPGGVVEHGESPWAAVVRETREETGIEVEPVRLAVVDWKAQRADIVFAFECRITGGALATSAETSEVGFFAPSAYPAALPARLVERIAQVRASHPRVVLKLTP